MYKGESAPSPLAPLTLTPNPPAEPPIYIDIITSRSSHRSEILGWCPGGSVLTHGEKATF